MDGDTQATLDAIERNTRAIAQMLAVSVGKEAVAKVRERLDTRQKIAAYTLTDGSRSAREVGRLSETSHTTIARWWADWIAEELADAVWEGKAKARLDLELYGITGPVTT